MSKLSLSIVFAIVISMMFLSSSLSAGPYAKGTKEINRPMPTPQPNDGEFTRNGLEKNETVGTRVRVISLGFHRPSPLATSR